MAAKDPEPQKSRAEELDVAYFMKEELYGAFAHGRNAQAADDRGMILKFLLVKLEPKGPLETMMVSHMVTAHEAAMSCFRRAMLPNQSPKGIDMFLRHGDRLMRLFNEQAALLTKLRGGTNQNVTVKHLYIADGAQAVIGSVNTGRGGAAARRTPSTPAALDLPRETPMTMPEVVAKPEPVMRTMSNEHADTQAAPKRRVRR